MKNAADLQVDTKGHETEKAFIHAEPREYVHCPAKSDKAENMHITRESCL